MMGILIVCAVLVFFCVAIVGYACVRVADVVSRQSNQLYRLAAQYSLMSRPNDDATAAVAEAVFGDSEKVSNPYVKRKNRAMRVGDMNDQLTPLGEGRIS